MEQQDWAATVGNSIASEVRRHRLARGLSAQQLADACSDLGFSIARTVISNIENGRRTNVSVAEVLVLARALGVPPGVLVFPAGYEKEVEYLPGRRSDPLRALDWLAGENLAPHERKPVYSYPPRDTPSPTEWAVYLMRKHRDVLNRIGAALRAAWEDDIEAAHYKDPVLAEEVELTRAIAKQLGHQLYEIREEIKRRGLVLPDLPPGLRVEPRPEIEPVGLPGDDALLEWRTSHGPQI